MEQIFEAVGQYAFPIVMTVIMAWYVKYTEDKHREERQQLTKDHRDEVAALKEAVAKLDDAIANNTLALQHLTDHMEIKNDKGN